MAGRTVILYHVRVIDGDVVGALVEALAALLALGQILLALLAAAVLVDGAVVLGPEAVAQLLRPALFCPEPRRHEAADEQQHHDHDDQDDDSRVHVCVPPPVSGGPSLRVGSSMPLGPSRKTPRRRTAALRLDAWRPSDRPTSTRAAPRAWSTWATRLSPIGAPARVPGCA